MSKTHQRMFEGLKIVDAQNKLRIIVNKEDIRTAIKKDPAHCVYANACRRLYGSHAVVFYRTLAYVELPDGKGGHHIERFQLTDPTRRLIARFDRTGKMAPDGYILLPPSKRKTLDYILKKDREYRTSGAKAAAEARRKKTPARAVDNTVRNGSGVVQFITHAKKSLKMA